MKTFIKNRHDQKLSVVVELADKPRGIAFLMHGLGGFKDQPQIRAFAEAFLDENYSVISFDAANTLGESEGSIEEASITTYYSDLEDVIDWAQTQDWYREPFILLGHSLGGICTALYAEKHPEKVSALAPLAAVISGRLSLENLDEDFIETWKKSGWLIKESNSKPGQFKRIPWSEAEDRVKYDLLPEVTKLTMPVLLIVGELDDTTPLKHQQLLFDKLPGQKELHVIKGSKHTFRNSEHLKEIQVIIKKWLEKIN